ncbi:MAG: hypothetical protein ACI9XJ_001842 [Marivirga sp.]|jgi:hypothetical protein
MKRITTVFTLSMLSLSTQAQFDPSTGKAQTYIIAQVTIDSPIKKVPLEFANVGGDSLNRPHVDSCYISSEQRTGVGATRLMTSSPMIKDVLQLTKCTNMGRRNLYEIGSL